MAVDESDVARFGELYQRFMEDVLAAAPPREAPPFQAILGDHLGANPKSLPVVAEDIAGYEHTALQLAIDAHVAAQGGQVMGVLGGQKRFMSLSMSDLLGTGGGSYPAQYFPLRPGPVEHVNLPVGPDRTLPCLGFGLVLTRTDGGPVALLVRAGQDRGPAPGLSVEAVAPDREQAAAFLAELRGLMAKHHPARGQVVSLSHTGADPSRGIVMGPGGLRIDYHERPSVSRDAIVLGPGVLERIEAEVIGMADRRDLLRAAGRHVKRGLLLHGPPGTGKTLTARYLIGRMPQATVVLLTGASLRFVPPSCQLARSLQPAIVVMEDVDLIAEERTMPGRGQMPLLFDLLNEMDGMAEDADVCFVLTTNRADLLEPALAARPGRVDLAVEIPLPDADCRRRLLDLYGTGLDLRLADPDRIIERTEGVSAAFIKELLRKATLEGAARAGPVSDGTPATVTVTDEDVAAALDPLLSESARLTRTLLGTQADGGTTGPSPGVPDRLRWLPGVQPR